MITIQLSPLSYRVKVSPLGQLFGTDLFLKSYMARFCHTTWDHVARRYILYRRYVHYDAKTETLYLPRYDFEDFCKHLDINRVSYQIEPITLQEGLPIEIPLKSHVKDRNEQQTAAIRYLTESPESLRGLSLSTGLGKTFCAIKSVSIIGRRSMICVSGLIDQWKREIFNFTDLKEEDIYVIQGAASMTKLLLKIDKTLFPKIILCSLGTIRAYAIGADSYENYPHFTTLFDLLQVGVKIIDEAHLNFFLTLMLDLQLNPVVNIALTATFDRGDPQVKQIYDSHYPKLMRFGENIFNRYIDIYSYNFSLGGMIPSTAYTTTMGYNHSKLEEWLTRKGKIHLERIYKSVYLPAIYSHYMNRKSPGQKLLILCSSIVMCEWLRKKLITDLLRNDDLTIDLYTYETDDSVLTSADVIISTPGSAGTGTDIKGLRTVLMTIATGSSVLNTQTLGRLRELPSGDTPVYAYTWCRDIQQHCNYQETRINTYRARGREFHDISL